MNNNLRALTFEQWSTINVALCGARLGLNGVLTDPIRCRKELDEAINALNEFKEID